MKYTDIFCNSQKWKYEILIIFVNLQMNFIIGTIFEQVSKKSVFSKFWRQIIVQFAFLWKIFDICEVWENVSLAQAKQRYLEPVCCCSFSLKQIEIHSRTMDLKFSKLDFVEISSYEYDAYMSWNMAEYVKLYQTKIWECRATLELSNGVFGFLVRRLLRFKSLSES